MQIFVNYVLSSKKSYSEEFKLVSIAVLFSKMENYDDSTTEISIYYLL